MVMEGIGLAAKDGMFGKSDPYFVLKRLRKGTEDVAFEYKSEHIAQNLNPVWQPAYMCFSEMCNGDLDEQIRLEVWDYDAASSPDMIGWMDVSLNQLLTKEPLKLNDRPGGRTADPGSIKAKDIQVHRTPNFLDYIMEGCDLTISVAVDFTASNKDIDDPVSLHHLSDAHQNQYQLAMASIGAVILDYDHDKKVGAMGFGAIVPGAEEASHCFPLKFDLGPGEYNVDGLQGLMDAYSDSISKAKLYGPTNFQNVIDQQALMAKECQKSAYHILMILTDGDITDKQETIAAIVRASKVPMSMILTLSLIHALTHAHTRTHKHTRARTHTPTHTCTHTHAGAHAYHSTLSLSHILTHTHTHTHTHARRCPCVSFHSLSLAHTHSYSHTHTHTHAHKRRHRQTHSHTHAHAGAHEHYSYSMSHTHTQVSVIGVGEEDFEEMDILSFCLSLSNSLSHTHSYNTHTPHGRTYTHTHTCRCR